MIAIDNKAYPAKTLVSWFWRKYVRKRLPMILLATGLMALEGATLGVLSYMVRPMFDQIFVGGQRDAVFTISMIVFAVFIGRAVVGFLQRLVMAYTARNMSADLQLDLVRHLLTLDINFFRVNSPGVLIERVRGDSGGAISIVSTTFSAMGRDFMALVSLLAVAVSIDWLWTLLALVGAPLMLFPIVFLQKLIRKFSRILRDAAARITTRLDEIFHGIATIKLNTTEAHEAGRFEKDIRKMVQAGLRSTAANAGIPALMDIVAAVGLLGVLMYGGLQVIDGDKTVGEFMSFFTAIALVFEPMRRLGKISGAWQTALVSMERVYGVFQQIPTITSPAKPVELTTLPAQADVVFENVSFDYGEQSILRDVSFRAKAGTTTALVGASGAGKSTVFNVLARLVDAATGHVSIGDTDICALRLEDLRSMISVVTQDTQLFDETIRDNMLLGKPATDEQLLVALDAAHVSDFLSKLSDGVDTHAGPRGSGLSGGQRQRVAIARALLRDTPILLLDEATSALDAKSEAIVQEALDRLSKGRTTLVIAHRLATVRGADNIIVMDQGRIVDQGTHEELIKRDGIYAGLYQLQFAETSQE